MAHSSPEPAARWFEEGLVRRGACRRAPHAERAVMAHSSPEPAARWFEEGEPRTGFCVIVLGPGGAASGSRDHLVTGRPYGTECVRGGRRVGRGACRRAPHAERAVMAHSSPEPAARWYGEGLVRRGLVGVLRTQREL